MKQSAFDGHTVVIVRVRFPPEMFLALENDIANDVPSLVTLRLEIEHQSNRHSLSRPLPPVPVLERFRMEVG